MFSYILTHDSGFAPNPFHGRCTLACCKPKIRATARKGDWVVGLGHGGKTIIYAMKLSKTVPFGEYWRAYPKKRPRWFSKDDRLRVGDNIYKPRANAGFEQRPSCHSHPNGSPRRGAKTTDLGGKNVLVSRQFVYFGANAVERPANLEFLRVRRGHRTIRDAWQIAEFERWFARQPRGRRGSPARCPPAALPAGCCACG